MSTLVLAPTAGRHLGSLLWTLVRTDFKVRYHGTAGGFLWALLKPFLMFVVLMSVFSFLFASDPAYKFNLVIGLFLYDFFGEATKAGLMSLHAKGYLLAKARFPVSAVVVASIANSWITLGILAVVVVIFASGPEGVLAVPSAALFAAYLVLYTVIVIGFSLAASVLYLKFRDLNQVWEVIIQAGFFLAPVVYPLTIIPEQYHFYMFLWPPTAVIQFSRMVLVEGAVPTPTAHAYLLIEATVVLLAGILIYRHFAPRAAESL